jgi:hexokinase
MVGGHYLGELVRIMAQQLVADGLLFAGCRRDLLLRPYTLSAADLGLFLVEGQTGWPEELLGLQVDRDKELVRRDRGILSGLAGAVCRRSAQLAAATFAGVIQYLDPQQAKVHAIGIDGSLYEKMPHYASCLQETLAQLLRNDNATRICLVKDGSATGAAIAAALVTNNDN